MAIKAGQILHAMNRSVVDRIQTAGAGNLNIPTEKIRELGNYQTVATVRDIPDLSFNLDCLDVDTEVEALLTGVSSADVETEAFGDPDGATPTEAAEYDLLQNYAVNITSPWKSRQGDFDVIRAVAIPALTLEQASYRYGLRENAGETFTLRGDSIFYIPGSVWTYETAGDGATDAFLFTVQAPPPPPGKTGPVGDETVTALLYEEGGEQRYALEVSINYERLVKGDDYTETNAGIELTQRYIDRAGVPGLTDKVCIVFGYDPADLPGGEDVWGQAVHQGLTVKPAAVRGKDLDLYVALTEPNQAPVWDADQPNGFRRWSDVQAFNVDWRVTIEDDFEFGNSRAVNRDYSDSPEVTGSVEVRHRNLEAMFEKLYQITGVTPGDVIGPQSSLTVHVLLVLKNPEGHGTTSRDVGQVLKTLYIPDARFVLPGYEGRVQQKLNQTMNFDSDGGFLKVFKGKPSDSQFMAIA